MAGGRRVGSGGTVAGGGIVGSGGVGVVVGGRVATGAGSGGGGGKVGVGVGVMLGGTVNTGAGGARDSGLRSRGSGRRRCGPGNRSRPHGRSGSIDRFLVIRGQEYRVGRKLNLLAVTNCATQHNPVDAVTMLCEQVSYICLQVESVAVRNLFPGSDPWHGKSLLDFSFVPVSLSIRARLLAV